MQESRLGVLGSFRGHPTPPRRKLRDSANLAGGGFVDKRLVYDWDDAFFVPLAGFCGGHPARSDLCYLRCGARLNSEERSMTKPDDGSRRSR